MLTNRAVALEDFARNSGWICDGGVWVKPMSRHDPEVDLPGVVWIQGTSILAAHLEAIEAYEKRNFGSLYRAPNALPTEMVH